MTLSSLRSIPKEADLTLSAAICETDEFRNFVALHRHEEISRLRLKYGGVGCSELTSMALLHIECLQKCGNKFEGNNPELMLTPVSVEQATSRAIAREHAKIAAELCAGSNKPRVLEMTCGLGIDLEEIANCLHAQADAFELMPLAAKAAAFNFRNNPEIKIQLADSVEFLRNRRMDEPKYDLTFIDPARRGASGERLYNIEQCQPNVVELLPLLRLHTRAALVKLSPMLDVKATLRSLPDAIHLYIMEEKGECKELVAVLDFNTSNSSKTAEISVVVDGKTINLAAENHSEIRMVDNDYRFQGKMLYEPSPAMMKAAPWEMLSDRGLRKLHPNSNLFVGDSMDSSLPGRWLTIEEVLPLSSGNLRALGARQLDCIGEIAVRNCRHFSPEILAKKLKIKKLAGEKRIMATTVMPDVAMLFVLRKLT